MSETTVEEKRGKDDGFEEIYRDESFRDALSTVDEEGKRVWLYPKKPKGRFFNWRAIVSVFLLAFLFLAPIIKINGQPLLLFDFFNRKFAIFGQIFWPQDFYLFVLSVIASVIFIIVFTVAYGRIFCGWVCPQTIFMEMVFRRIEYWIEGDYMAQRKLNKQSWNREKIIKRVTKHTIYLAISFLIMHTFISYLIGFESMVELVQTPPTENIGGFMAMLGFTAAFYIVFSQLREQVCTSICPYGRLQGVLLDRNSIVVAYDHQRGEPRGKIRKGQERKSEGDCIDCKQCVVVCPTGIDIRNGTQLECVNCTACIDACDSIMDRVGYDRGLIRYASEANISDRVPFRFTGRLKFYSVVLTLIVGLLISLLLLRSDIEATVLRTPGMLFQDREDGTVSNLYNYKVVNKTAHEVPFEFRVQGADATIQLVGELQPVEGESIAEGALFIIMKKDDIERMSTKLKVEVYRGDEKLQTIKTTFLGPAN